MENKRDLSVSMERANVFVFFVSIPVAVAQFALFSRVHGGDRADITWGFGWLSLAVVLGIIVHELIHGVTWMLAGRKPPSSIKYGIQWKTLTPYAHLKEPIEVNAYRMGAFMPGLILGFLVYFTGLALGDGNLLWFSLIHTAAAGGDWLILWLIRKVKAGSLVEDHPTNAGCYALEPVPEPR